MKKKIFAVLFCLMLILSLVSFGISAQSIPDTRQCERLVDDADLLTDTEEKDLLTLLDSESEENKYDFVIHTVNSVGDKTIRDYSDDYFDYNGFGYGDEGDGMVLVIAMDIKEYYISTCGRGKDLFSFAARSYCEDEFVPHLKSGDYYRAFMGYLTAATDVVEAVYTDESYYNNNDSSADNNGGYVYENDYSYDYDGSYHNDTTVWELLCASLIVGFIIAIVIAGIHAGKLKSVKPHRSAANYVRDGSLHIDVSSDRFLYKHVTRRHRPKQNTTRGGGGGVHVGSSGRSHGGGGGKF